MDFLYWGKVLFNLIFEGKVTGVSITVNKDPRMNNRLLLEMESKGIILRSVEKVLNYARAHSLWPLGFGLACCAFELMAVNSARYDMARFGYEVFRPSPRQADLLIVSGTVTKKMAPILVRLYEQMAEPTYVVAMGSCAISGGPFRDSYNVIQGVNTLMPVDVYIPGCPPRPEAFQYGLIKLRELVKNPKVARMVDYE